MSDTYVTAKGNTITLSNSLEAWNDLRRQAWADKLRKVTHPEEFSNGLVCPECAGDLYDTGRVFPGPPSRMVVKCKKCKFRGEKIE
jgi:hypothetical protein